MKSKSTTQKLKVRWQERSWLADIETQAGEDPVRYDRVAIYETEPKSSKSDTQLIVRNRNLSSNIRVNSNRTWKN